MTFYKVKQAGPSPALPLFSNVSTEPWGRVELALPQSIGSLRVSLTKFPSSSRAANWRRFDPSFGTPRQFFAGSWAIGRRLAPLALETRPFTINRPESIINVPAPQIILPWPQPPGNSGNVPTPTLVDRYYSLYLWLAEGVQVSVWDDWTRWLWVRE